MNLSMDGLALIKRFEGFSPKPYLCPAQRWTMGYGHVLTPVEHATFATIDEALAERWLMQDAAIAEHAVNHLIGISLQQPQFDALVSFTFNLGAGALQRSTLRRVINRAENEAIPKQWMRWVWGGGRRLPGLARRRAAELALYLKE